MYSDNSNCLCLYLILRHGTEHSNLQQWPLSVSVRYFWLKGDT